jgi:PAS domain S-box-containing protein
MPKDLTSDAHEAHRPIGALLVNRLTLPNLISCARLAVMPVLLIAAWYGRQFLYIFLFAVTLLLATADGVIARRLNRVTEFGAELDSWGTFATYVAVPLGALMLWPDIVHREAAFIIAVVGFHIVPATLGLLKYGRLPSYHTWGSTASAILLGGTTFLMMVGGPAWPFRVVTPVIVLSGIEQIFITAILRQWQSNIPSLYHAIKIEQAKVEKALAESQEKYRTILTNIEDGYFEVDLAGNLTFFNPTLLKYLGYTENELLGMNNRDLMSREQAKIAYEAFNEVYRTGRNRFVRDWEIIGKEGQRRFFETSVVLMRDSRGQPIGFRCFGRDTTERKQAEEKARVHQEQLHQAGKMVALGTLVSGVAHDINNPNNFIMLNAPLLKEAWEDIRPILTDYYEENGDFVIAGMNFTEMQQRVPDLFDGIIDGSRRIQHIVDDLKKFVRKGRPDLTEKVDVNSVVKSAISLLHHMIEKSTRRFKVSYAENLPALTGNFNRLEQVVINLIQNACQALPHRRSGVSVSTAFDTARRSIVITIEDEGRGIPAESLPRITDTFYSTKYEQGGIGLGLSISARIVEEHGGRISFRSLLEKGTSVDVDLPVLKSGPAAEEVSR